MNDTGDGSLRNGITTATGTRTTVFAVSGNIVMDSNLTINKSNLTIAVSLLITPPPPQFVQVDTSAGKVVLGGVGGVPLTSYYLLAATNPTLPTVNWPRIATNQFNAAGNSNLTN